MGHEHNDPAPRARGLADGGNLPIRLTSFIGREAESAAVSNLLDRERLVTLRGAGGCGKTRFALQLAADRTGHHPGGVWWVDLSRLADDELVGDAIASALEIKEVPGRPLANTLTDELQGEHLLLLDNCEHLVETCASIAHELLRSSPGLSILATSREPLGVEGEFAWRVPPCSSPTPARRTRSSSRASPCACSPIAPRASARSSAPLTRMQRRSPRSARRLDGMPLAIELAAARSRMMTPQQIADGLEDRFRLLTSSTRTVLPRYRALRASVDWSHDLLSDEERIVLRRLAVFTGGFTLEAAEAVCSGEGVEPESLLDLLSRLVDRSLVQVEDDARYRLLETIRQYAFDRLMWSGEHEGTRDRHLNHFVAIAERAEPQLEGAGLLEWLPVLDVEHDNLRAAFDWSAQSKATDQSLRLVGALWLFWQLRGHLTEGATPS